MVKLSAIFRDWLPMARASTLPDRFFLWVDAVGGYWVCLGDAVVIGRPAAGGDTDVPILGDLAQRHASLRRDGEGYLVEALREVRVEGKLVSGVAELRHGNLIQLGQGVKLAFRRPHALSATARLDFVSHHGTQPSVDAVILMADSLVLGPKAESHIVCPDWRDEVVLYRQQNQLYCRASSPLEVDGSKAREPAKLTADSRVVGDWFSLSLEGM
jgi:hypothetical protein